MLRIGVNALYLIPGGVGGTEIYLRNLLAALGEIDSVNQYVVFTNRETGPDLIPDRDNFICAQQPLRASFRPARIVWEQIALPFAVRKHRLDILFNPGFTAPIACHCPMVTVFHDLQHKRHPEYFRWFDLPFWRLLLWASAHRSRTLIAPSEATREDLFRYYPFTRGRVTVIPHGVDQAFFALDRSKIEPYVLCVSTLHPHKNLERLIRAYARKQRDFKLVIAGMRGFHSAAVEALIAELGCGEEHLSQTSVRVTGWIPRDELMRLYAGARAFIYPSTFEGFGMPVLEAMAAGIPVACSDIPPLREVAGDAALFFDPSDDGAVAAALDRIASDET